MSLDFRIDYVDKNYFVDKKNHFINNRKIREFITLLRDTCELMTS